MDSLTYLRGRRLWVIRDYAVWGVTEGMRVNYLCVEEANNAGRILFGEAGIGETEQDVIFTELTDFRGNRLPDKIASPKVVVGPRSQYPVYIVGNESDSGFRIARDPSAPGAVHADLFIYEMGV